MSSNKVKNVYIKYVGESLKYRESKDSTIYDTPAFIYTPETPNKVKIETNNRGGILNIIMNFNRQYVIDNNIGVFVNFQYPSFPYNGQMNLRLFAYNTLINYKGALPYFGYYSPENDFAFCGTYKWLSTSGDTDLFGLNLKTGSRYYNDTWYAGDWYSELGEVNIVDLRNDDISIMYGIEINDRDYYTLYLSDFYVKNLDTDEILYSNNFQSILREYEDISNDDYGVFSLSSWVKVKKEYIKDSIVNNVKKVFIKGE